MAGRIERRDRVDNHREPVEPDLGVVVQPQACRLFDGLCQQRQLRPILEHVLIQRRLERAGAQRVDVQAQLQQRGLVAHADVDVLAVAADAASAARAASRASRASVAALC